MLIFGLSSLSILSAAAVLIARSAEVQLCA
jgi:hypothetical protein